MYQNERKLKKRKLHVDDSPGGEDTAQESEYSQKLAYLAIQTSEIVFDAMVEMELIPKCVPSDQSVVHDGEDATVDCSVNRCDKLLQPSNVVTHMNMHNAVNWILILLKLMPVDDESSEKVKTLYEKVHQK